MEISRSGSLTGGDGSMFLRGVHARLAAGRPPAGTATKWPGPLCASRFSATPNPTDSLGPTLHPLALHRIGGVIFGVLGTVLVLCREPKWPVRLLCPSNSSLRNLLEGLVGPSNLPQSGLQAWAAGSRISIPRRVEARLGEVFSGLTPAWAGRWGAFCCSCL